MYMLVRNIFSTFQAHVNNSIIHVHYVICTYVQIYALKMKMHHFQHFLLEFSANNIELFLIDLEN